MANHANSTPARRAESSYPTSGLFAEPKTSNRSSRLDKAVPPDFLAAPDWVRQARQVPAVTGCDVTGLRVLVSPRDRLHKDLRMLPFRTAAAYILLRDDVWSGEAIARVGETMDVQTRMARHLHDGNVAWFSEVAIIYGPAVNKFSAHALQYLTHVHLVAADRCIVVGVDPNPPQRGALLEALPLFEKARLCLGAVGIDLLEERVERVTAEDLETDDLDGFNVPREAERVALLRHAGYRAAAAQVDGGWQVLARSEIRYQAQRSARPCDVHMRESLARARALAPIYGRPDMRLLLRDVPVPSLDAAGKFILGNRRSLTRAWEDVYAGGPVFRA